MLKYHCYTIHEVGLRPRQEDSVYPEIDSDTGEGIFIVCDGMGGHDAGDVASAVVRDAISSHPELSFEDALSYAYDMLDEKDNGSLRKMGTTLAYLRLDDGKALVAHIGDSRVYQVRPSEKRMLFMTRDHSLVNELVSAGMITPKEAHSHPQISIITRAMQPNCERMQAEIDLLDDVRPGDWFFVCSDGMLESLDDDNIVNVLSMRGSDERKIAIIRSVTADARDNHSALLIKIKDEPAGI